MFDHDDDLKEKNNVYVVDAILYDSTAVLYLYTSSAIKLIVNPMKS